ncbi:hypothetical protein UPYG_G00126640 [Umbra pygmaea]|uniref:Shroom n=1 Tax=Umbra pygmaea TaxID=75934 RepID=A0ABD0X679_UMBPY
MDSYNFHFERMSNLDLHPLSLPVSRLSPAKSTSSIDQFTHHHGKGDSAYSSFSGGSSAPDYTSTFFPDDFQHHSLHYADLKYVKAIYHPNVVDSDSRSMDELYRSVEAISNQYRHHRNSSIGSPGTGQYSNQKKKMPPPPPPPPPPPTRMDSFTAARNLENCRTERASEVINPDLVYGRRASQTYRPVNRLHSTEEIHQHRTSGDALSPSPSQTRQNERRPDEQGVGHSVGQHKRVHPAHMPLMLEPPRSTSPWHVAQSMVNSSIQHKGQFYFVTGICNSPKSSLKHASVCGSDVGSENPGPQETSQHTVDDQFRKTQHKHLNTQDTTATDKREFYTKSQDGKSRSQDDEKPTHRRISYGTSHVSNQDSHSFDALEQMQQIQGREIGRHHSPNHHIFYCGPEDDGSPSSKSQVSHFPVLSKSSDQLDQLCSNQGNPGADWEMGMAFFGKDQVQEIAPGETKRKPLFKQDSAPQLGAMSVSTVPPLASMEQATSNKRDEQARGGGRQLLGDLANEKINKETTPLLYHLTGANREVLGLFKPKKGIELGVKGEETGLCAAPKECPGSCGNTTPLAERSKEESVEDVSHPFNILDNSFKKYYKEKLKDAQSMVLRETSFKRKDLQLSWPHRVRPKPGLRPTILHTVSTSQDSENSADPLTLSTTSSEKPHADIVMQTTKEGVEKGGIVGREGEKQNGRPVNVAQPQVARVGGRRRLTPEQKKMCYSEPEKLNRLGDTPSTHAACHSLGNEREGLLELSNEEGGLGEQGLVAARRKMFETRGRAMSASSLSKTSLKHLQHKALVAYMERKMGHKVAEPQQPAPPASRSPSQRNSTAGRTFDWALRSANKASLKKKPHRPHSAGRILDSTSSSIRYAQFSSSLNQTRGPCNQAAWRESPSPSQVKSASAESLLDQPEPPVVSRIRSTSTPHSLLGLNYMNDPSPANSTDNSSFQTEGPVDEASTVARRGQAVSIPEGLPARVAAQRGKSLEELGVPQDSQSPVLSKSSKKKLLQKQDSAPQLGNQEESREMTKRTRESSAPVSPKSSTTSWVRLRSDGSPGSYDFGPLVKDEVNNSMCSESFPPPPDVQEPRERDAESTSISPTTPIRPWFADDGRTGSGPSRVRSTHPAHHSVEREESVDDPSETPPPEFSQEVSLSCGVTTDPSLWHSSVESGNRDEDEAPVLSNDLTEAETSPPGPVPASSEHPPTSAATTPDPDSCQGEEDKHPQNEKGPEEEGGSLNPIGETESPERTSSAKKPKWEEMVEEVVAADKSLARVLYPLTNRKTALMLMEQLLSEDNLLMEEHYKKKQEDRESSTTPHPTDRSETVEVPPNCPADEETQHQPDPSLSTMAVSEKKRLLVACVEERLRSLEEPRGALQAELQENGLRGEAMEALVRERCTAVELERYGLFIGDLERVVSLLLCLSARLARVQNALTTVDQHTDAEEKDSLDNRHKLLCKQRDDAKDLKDNLDRRERMVSNFLSRCLTAEQLQDYRRFVQTKASLLIRMKDLDERQRLGEEQLESLLNTLPS